MHVGSAPSWAGHSACIRWYSYSPYCWWRQVVHKVHITVQYNDIKHNKSTFLRYQYCITDKIQHQSLRWQTSLMTLPRTASSNLPNLSNVRRDQSPETLCELWKSGCWRTLRLVSKLPGMVAWEEHYRHAPWGRLRTYCTHMQGFEQDMTNPNIVTLLSIEWNSPMFSVKEVEKAGIVTTVLSATAITLTSYHHCHQIEPEMTCILFRCHSWSA